MTKIEYAVTIVENMCLSQREENMKKRGHCKIIIVPTPLLIMLF